MTLEVRGLLLDFGGTLDTDGVHWALKYGDVYARLGVNVRRTAIEQAFIDADRTLAKEEPLSGGGIHLVIERQVALQLAALATSVAGFEPSPGLEERLVAEVWAEVSHTLATVRPLLAQLAERHRLAVVSNYHGNLVEALTECELVGSLSATVDSALVSVWKPDPEIFRLGARRLQLEPSECAVVGDSYDRDVVPGKAAGCRTVWLRRRPFRPPAEVSQADVIIGSLAELPERLR
jgi:HAD superfamily hydrolase (TIGR01509 family)